VEAGASDGILGRDRSCASTGTIRGHHDVAWPAAGRRSRRADGVGEALLPKVGRAAEAGGTLLLYLCVGTGRGRSTAYFFRALLATERTVRRAPIDAAEVAGLAEILTRRKAIATFAPASAHDAPRLGGARRLYAARVVKSWILTTVRFPHHPLIRGFQDGGLASRSGLKDSRETPPNQARRSGR